MIQRSMHSSDLDMLLADRPRTLSSRSSSCWHIFTDASFEPEANPPFSGIGAVLVNQSGVKERFFSEKLPEELLTKINVTGRKTIIFECEFFAVLCALRVWKNSIQQSNVVIHTDNDAVRDCFISCHTTSENAIPILDACLNIECELECNTWITRVPTESNIADDPSRLEVQKLLEAGCVRDAIDVHHFWLTMVTQSVNGSNGGEAIDQPARPSSTKDEPSFFASTSRVVSEELK